jgi:signal transduction histidine kinase
MISVLLVEDSPYDRELATFALQRAEMPEGPIDVVTASLWAAAHDRLRSRRFDVLILDFDLPGPNGLEILQVLAGIEHPPVIMLTGQQDVGRAIEMLRSGAVEYVPKTSGEWLAELKAAVGRVLSRVREERERAAAAAEREARAADLEGEMDALAREAASAAVVREEILANFSHELRTPLNIIQGYADLLLEGAAEANARETLGRIRSSASRLAGVVASVLDLKDLTRGTAQLHPSRFSLEALAREVACEVRFLADDQDLEIEWYVDAADSVQHDREKLRRILLELLSNVAKYATQSRAGIELRQTAEGGLVLVVRDEGPGFDPSRLDEAIEDMRQLDGSATRHHGGLGIGLGLVRRVTAWLGGRMRVESAVGRGTRVTVEIPPCADGPAPWIGVEIDGRQARHRAQAQASAF